MKRRFKFASYFTMTAFGVAMMMFLLYFIISEPETLTWYEMILTYVLSVFIADWLYKNGESK